MSDCRLQGFLRRVHRYPVLLAPSNSDPPPPRPKPVEMSLEYLNRFRGQEFASTPAHIMAAALSREVLPSRLPPDSDKTRGRPQEPLPTIIPGAELATSLEILRQPTRRASAAETSLEQLRSRDLQKTGDRPTTRLGILNRPGRTNSTATAKEAPRHVQLNASLPVIAHGPVSSSPQFSNLRMSPDALGATDSLESEHSSGGRSTRPRLTRSPSAPAIHPPHTAAPFPPDLIPMLDGEHHTDEICTRFNVGWPLVEQWLVIAGGGKGNSDYGNVIIIHR